MDKENVVHMYNGILSSVKERGNSLFETTWMNPGDIVPSTVSKTQTNTLMMSVVCGIQKGRIT
jgi:hypothetical protein